MKALGKLVVVAFAASFLALLTLFIFAWASGTLSMGKIGTVKMALEGKLVPPEPKSEPQKDLTDRYEKEALKEAMRALEDLKKQKELVLVELNERRAQIAKLEGEAAAIRKELSDASETLAKAQKAFDDRQKAYEQQTKSDGFKKAAETLAGMKKTVVAKILYDYDTQTTVELLKAFESDFRAKVIEEMEKIDQLPENSGTKGKAAKLLMLIYQGDANLVTLQSE